MNNQFLAKYAPGVCKNETPKLRALVERSVGMHSSAPAAPAGLSAPQLGAVEVARIERALSSVLARAEQAIARLDAQQAQQAQVGRSRLLTPYEESQARTYVLKGSLPPQGVAPGGARTNVASWQASSPQGQAAAMLAEMRDGPMPSPIGVAKAKPNTVTVREAVRRSLASHRHPFY